MDPPSPKLPIYMGGIWWYKLYKPYENIWKYDKITVFYFFSNINEDWSRQRKSGIRQKRKRILEAQTVGYTRGIWNQDSWLVVSKLVDVSLPKHIRWSSQSILILWGALWDVGVSNNYNKYRNWKTIWPSLWTGILTFFSQPESKFMIQS